MAVWFTSDTHFNHEAIIGFSKRPYQSLEEMEESMITNWNESICKGDIVYHLGDFALSWGSKHAGRIDQILGRLNGTKFLIAGNHDRKEVLTNHRWCKVHQLHELKVDLGGAKKQRIVLCHYALRVWNQMPEGSWMLHGHSHGSLSDVGGKSMDVGVDCHAFRPIHIGQVRLFMENRQVVSCDHHRND